MNDLYLEYQFTDRAGRGVYNIITVGTEDVLGQIRLHPDKDDCEDRGCNVLLEWTEPEVPTETPWNGGSHS